MNTVNRSPGLGCFLSGYRAKLYKNAVLINILGEVFCGSMRQKRNFLKDLHPVPSGVKQMFFKKKSKNISTVELGDGLEKL